MTPLATVLFVDDEHALLEAVRITLRREPYQLITASSALEALALLARQPVTVVVSDEQMPGMSGSQFLAEVRRLHPDTIRIILTGQASMAAAIRAINDGEIYRFLSKPCSPTELANTIRDAIVIRGLRLGSSQLLAAVQEQRSLLELLESRFPGLTRCERTSDGTLVADDTDDLEGLIRKLHAESERVRADRAA